MNICSKCHEEKNLLEFTREKNTCNSCCSFYMKQYYKANKISMNAASKKYREINIEICKANSKIWKLKNSERRKEYTKAYNLKRKEHYKEYKKIWGPEYAKRNKDKINANCAKRHAQKLKAIPDWANLVKICEIYKQRLKISTETGIMYHVDHIIPLRGKTVCGLHVEYNLQIIPAKENLIKSNTLKYD